MSLTVVVIKGKFTTPKYSSLGYMESMCESYQSLMWRMVLCNKPFPEHKLGREWISLTIAFFWKHGGSDKSQHCQKQNKIK